MLKTLRLHNFRTYLNAELRFDSRHLIIGANNSGKSNLCAALSFLGATAGNDLSLSVLRVPGGVFELKNRVFDSDIVEVSCTCEIPFDGAPHVFTYDLELVIEGSSVLSKEGIPAIRVRRERLDVTGPGFNNAVLLENDGHEALMLHEDSKEGYHAKTLAPRDATMLSKLYELETNRRARAFRQYLARWQYYTLCPHAMRFEWRQCNQGFFPLSPRGENLSIVLYQLKNIDEGRYRSVIEHVRLIEPELEYLSFFPAPDQPAAPGVGLRGGRNAPWHGLSDGTLRCLALAFIAELGPPSVVMIEEPENGVYPGQLRAFFDQLLDRAPQTQFLFTSHSPYFINFFDASRDSVTLLRRSNERTEVLRVPPAEDDPDRPLLAEQYSMELF